MTATHVTHICLISTAEAECSVRVVLVSCQAPLQPLQDDLELQTYETFEKDERKYLQYEEAVLEALLDRVPKAEAATRETVLMVRPADPHVPSPVSQ